MHCFLNRHVFSWGATTTADPFPVSLTCDCGAVNREAATARPAPDDEALRAAERLVRECDLSDDYEPQSLISFEEDIRTVARYVLGLERRS
jgi:hypothetical protein